jgi:uncharacterized protein (TIGR00369 family)
VAEPWVIPRAASGDVESLVRGAIASQPFLRTIGARLRRAARGEVEIEMEPAPPLMQQHGYVHAGVVTTIADSACGIAAFTLMPAGANVLSVEFKVNLLAPARGALLVARGRVVRAGRTLTVAQGDVFALDGDAEVHVASMLSTMMNVGAPAGNVER